MLASVPPSALECVCCCSVQMTPDPLPAALPIQVHTRVLLLLLHLCLLRPFPSLLLLQAAARHATNRQVREAGMDDRVTVEVEEEFEAQEGPVQGHQNRKKKSKSGRKAEEWCHDGIKNLWGER